MSTDDNKNNKEDDIPNICANCGKGEEGSNSLKACTACKLVKYCNRECQIAHRPQHKKECKKRAKELHDEELFKQPPLQFEDCPICFQRMPELDTGKRYQTCCGKMICSGCIHAPVYDNQGNVVDNQKCPFCRIPAPETEEEVVERVNNRADVGDAMAIHNLGCNYASGDYGYPQDHAKALEFYQRARRLGNAASYFSIGVFYTNGDGVEADMKKAIHYWEVAAMRGDAMARHNLGCFEQNTDNVDRALKHYIIAARSGRVKSLEAVKDLYSKGHATKEDYSKALESYQTYMGEIKSDQRDEAAATDDDFKYIE